MEIVFFKKRVPYAEVDFLFNDVKSKNRNAVDEKIYILEHENVYTAGKSVLNNSEELKKKIVDIPVVYSDRGGLWTWHGAGQVIVYFVYDLKKHKKTISDFMNIIERCVVDVVKNEIVKCGLCGDIDNVFEITARQDKRGFWCRNLKTGDVAKFGFIGLRVKNGFVIHGISVNYSNDLFYFDFINPCGLGDVKITSIKEIVGDVGEKHLNIKVFKRTLGKALFETLS